MSAENQKEEENKLVINYLTLRKTIGFLGIFLPVLLPLGVLICSKIFSQTGVPALQCSISDYYHTHMRSLLVATIAVLAMFLFAYNGYDRRDQIAGKLACFFGLATAFIHDAPKTLQCEICDNLDGTQTTMHKIHLVCAGLFFLTLAYFSIFLFTISTKKTLTPNKKKRNLIYRVCGYTMVVCIVLSALVINVGALREKFIAYKPVFWLETIALWAFGFSWLIKGEFMLKDNQ